MRIREILKRERILNQKLYTWLVLSLLGAFLYAAMYNNVKPEILNINKLEVAEQTIRSPITIEDKEKTEERKREAEALVKPVYVVKQEYMEHRVDLVSSIFDEAIEVQNRVNEMKNEEGEIAPNGDGETTVPQEPTTSEKVTMLKESLTETIVNDLSSTTLTALVTHSQEELQIAKDATVTAVQKVMSTRIPATEVENAKKRVEDELRYISLPQSLKNAVIELGRYAVIQNEFYSPEKTEEARKQAVENVEPVLILQGQVIVEEGELITNEIYRQLEIVGLVNTEESKIPFIGLFLFIMLLVSFIYFYLSNEQTKEVHEKNHQLTLFTTVLLITILLMKVFSLMPVPYVDTGYLFPVAMTSMLIRILLDEKLSIVGTVIISICAVLLFNGEVSGVFHITAGLYALISSISGVIFLTNQNRRSKIFEAGLFVALINIITLTAFMFMQNIQFSNTMQYVFYFAQGAISGVTSSVLTIGLLPFLEGTFGILSTIKLIELSNPNHPLLKKILTEAPGTYHHSVMVANLAEAACEAIGANGLLARVASYYHDLGKTKNPHYFVENQFNKINPHDHLPPERSRDIIRAHTTDGAKMLRKYRMPKEIIDIALQHHGTSLLQYFYVKAKKTDPEVKEDDFRYPGPKPQTKEAAIIMIADSVEAAVRSMKEPDMEKISELIRKIIQSKLTDGQFSECDLSLKELNRVEHTLNDTLQGIFHQRIEYPQLQKNESIYQG